MTNELYFGTFSSYEEYYAIGSTAEEVKNLLWKMYSYACYNKPTKEDRQTFEDEVTIEKFTGVKSFGYSTAYKECYIIKGRKLERLKGE